MRKFSKYWHIAGLCLILSLCCIGAAYAYEINEGGEYNLSHMKSPVNINTVEPVTLTGKLSGEIACTVEGATLTLSGFKGTSREGCALAFTGAGNILILEGKNTIKSGGGVPGIRVEKGAELTIRGDGSLKVTGGGNGAGIGGGDCEESGTVTIESGEIIATGVGNGAGIGGGSCRDAGTIIITGGTITATGGEDGGAGIGGSSDNGYKKILITGGTIIASCGEGGGTGIGQGWNSGKIIPGGEITITGGTITANGGIGGGGANNGGFITIEGGDISSSGAIGGGSISFQENIGDGSITISGGTIFAGGGIGPASDIVISGGDITAIGNECCAGIDSSVSGKSDADAKTITITGGTIVAIGGGGAAGIGCAVWLSLAEINISGGDITATGGDPFFPTGEGWEEGFRFGGAAGIGCGCNSYVGNIIISGGTVRAIGGEEGAGIGTGNGGYCENVIITGGTVTATGGEYAAGIGRGYRAWDFRCVTISGGTVIAIGGTNSAGIGGGFEEDGCCETTITGDALVYAKKGDGGTYDIGAGRGGQNYTHHEFHIKKRAAVFLGTNVSATPVVKNHTKKWVQNKTNPMVPASYNGELLVYGIAGTGESPWVEAPGGWFVLCEVRYDANGGEGGAPESAGPVHITTPVTVAGGDGLSKESYTFSHWTAKADGWGKRYDPGDKIVFSSLMTELTLYAQWEGEGGTAAAAPNPTPALTPVPTPAFTPTPTSGFTAYDTVIDCGGIYDLSDQKATIHINTTEAVTLSGKINQSIDCTVEGVTLTLQGVQVESGGSCALAFTGGNNVLIVEGSNTLLSGGGAPGVRVEKGTELTIRGDGSLTATGSGGGAGIGGGDGGYGGSITIESGEITAYGSERAAGIGGGGARDGGTTVISGGAVTAIGGCNGGAGIGGANDCCGGNILITGGTIVATGSENGGCGIGEGWNSSARQQFDSIITITGGTITANGGGGERGIGGGIYSSGGIITIQGGTIIANGGIGGGKQGIDDGRITISDGVIKANGGIGGGCDIMISGGDIYTIGKDWCAAIDAGSYRGECDESITISGGNIVAIGGGGAAGIGCGPREIIGAITISGGTITATGGDAYIMQGADSTAEFGGGAGIGGGFREGCGKIAISGGTVKATGGKEGAGIGMGAESSRSAEITISGGMVEALGGNGSAGIGGGQSPGRDFRADCTVVMSGDALVYAKKGDGARDDIGAGDGGDGADVNIFIREQAAVFLGTNAIALVETERHEEMWIGNETNPMVPAVYNGELSIFGIPGTAESPWAEAQGGWFVLCTVHYDANGGEGSAPETTGPVHITEIVSAASAEGLSKEGYTFTCWNTKANLRGRTYFPGDEIVFSSSERDVTLYAQWDKTIN